MSARNRKLRPAATPRADPKLKCGFCENPTEDESTLGRMYTLGPLTVHYYCVLLSCCLVQRGKEEEGLFGFLLQDIQAEILRGKKYKCSFCSKGGATIGCCEKTCKKQFHLPCGRRNGCRSLFFGNYKSFCSLHMPKQRIPERILVKARARMLLETGRSATPECFAKKRVKEVEVIRSPIKSRLETLTEDLSESVCAVCYESVQAWPSNETFWPPCCARDSWFHLSCLQRMALSAGVHYFKCPLCNDKDVFHQAVVEQGIYVPDRDAAWELEQNAFAEHYEQALTCAAPECKCAEGREHDADTGIWELKLCLLCGSSATHPGCLTTDKNICVDCSAVPPPANLELLEKMAAAASESERRSSSPVWRPVMPCRMSIRRTKPRRTPLPSTLHAVVLRAAVGVGRVATPDACETDVLKERETETALNKIEQTRISRFDLGLKSPRRNSRNSITNNLNQDSSPKTKLKEPTNEDCVVTDAAYERAASRLHHIDRRVLSPLKLISQVNSQKCMELFEATLMENERSIRKPQPLHAKKKFIRDIVHKILTDWNKENDAVFREDPKEIVSITMDFSEQTSAETKILTENPPISTPVKINISQMDNENILSPKSCIITAEAVDFTDTSSVDIRDTLDNSTKSFEFPIIKKEDLDSALKAIKITNGTDRCDRNFVNNNDENDSENDVNYELATKVMVDQVEIDNDDDEIIISPENTNRNEVINVTESDSELIFNNSLGKCVILRDYLKNADKDNSSPSKNMWGGKIEDFKSQYLSEIKPSTSYKCTYNHRHAREGAEPVRLKSAIDYAIDAVMQKKREAKNISESEVITLSEDEKLTVNNIEKDFKPKKSFSLRESPKKEKKIKDKLKILPRKLKKDFILQKLKEEHRIVDSSQKEVTNLKKSIKKEYLKPPLIVIGSDSERYESIRSFKIPKKRNRINTDAEENKAKHYTEERRKKRKHEDAKRKHKKSKKSKRDKGDCETEISFRNDNVKLKIKLRYEKEFKVKMKDSCRESNSLKQTVLNFSPERNNEFIKTEYVKKSKGKRSKVEVSPDGLKQTSISSFFTPK